MALQNEKYGQAHSNLDSQQESDEARAKNRKHPRTKFSCDSDEGVAESKRRKCGKGSTKLREQSSKRHQQPLSSDDSDDNQYIFIKTASKGKDTTVGPTLERDEANTPVGTFESVGDTAITLDQHIDVSVNGNQIDDTSDAVGSNNETALLIPIVARSPDQHDDDDVILENFDERIEVLFENDDASEVNETTEKTSPVVQFVSDSAQINGSEANNIVMETIDFSENVLGTILQKLTEVLQNQNDFKKVLVDLTYRTMKLEQRIKMMNNTPNKDFVRQLGCPVKHKENFAEVQVRLEDNDNYDKLLQLASNFQAPSVNEFVKTFFKQMLDLDFLYNHIVWRKDGDKLVIKDTKLAHCMFAALKIKFPQVDEKKLEEDAITATRQLKDCYRKKKPPPEVEKNL